MNKQEINDFLARLEAAAAAMPDDQDDDAIEGEYEETNLITGVTTYHAPAAAQDTEAEPEQESQEQTEPEPADQDEEAEQEQESQEQTEPEPADQDEEAEQEQAEEAEFTEIPDYQDTNIPDYQDTSKSNPAKILIIFLLIGLILSTAAASVTYFFYTRTNARAVITLYPDIQTIRRSVVFTDAQIPIRTFQTVKQQSKIVQTTGIISRPATSAAGELYFYNASPAPQVINAGTVLTASNGIQVITDTATTIPGAHPPTEGSAAAPAHSLTPGAAGNIQADAISGVCCNSYTLFAYNGRFSGGAAAYSYHTATDQDIENASANLKPELDQESQDATRQQIAPGESPIAQNCTTRSSANAQPGAEADSVTVTLSEQCTGSAYPTNAIASASSAFITSVARKELGTLYTSTAAPQIKINGISKAGTITRIAVNINATYIFQIPLAEQQDIKNALAGKTREQAGAYLFTQKGVSRAQIDSPATLPDASRINLQIVSVI